MTDAFCGLGRKLLVALALGLATVPAALSSSGPPDSVSSQFPARCQPTPEGTRSPARPRPAAGHWRREPPAPIPREELKGATVGRLAYLVGGLKQDATSPQDESTAIVLAYDPARKRYRRTPDLPEPLDHVVPIAYRGALYVIGGYSNRQPRASMWRYSPRTKRWRSLPAMGLARGAAGGARIGHRLYVVGGSDERGLDSRPLSRLEVYDFRKRRWRRGPSMPTPRHHVEAVALGGKLYAIAGRGRDDASLATVEAYDPRRRRWKRLPDLPLGVGGPAATVAAGRIVVSGGGDFRQHWVTPAVWALDPETPRWRRLPDLERARHAHAAATLDDRTYVFGGALCDNSRGSKIAGSRSAESLHVR